MGSSLTPFNNNFKKEENTMKYDKVSNDDAWLQALSSQVEYNRDGTKKTFYECQPSDYLMQYTCKAQRRSYEDMYHNTIDYKVKKYINDKLDILISFIRKMKCDII